MPTHDHWVLNGHGAHASFAAPSPVDLCSGMARRVPVLRSTVPTQTQPSVTLGLESVQKPGGGIPSAFFSVPHVAATGPILGPLHLPTLATLTGTSLSPFPGRWPLGLVSSDPRWHEGVGPSALWLPSKGNYPVLGEKPYERRQEGVSLNLGRGRLCLKRKKEKKRDQSASTERRTFALQVTDLGWIPASHMVS